MAEVVQAGAPRSGGRGILKAVGIAAACIGGVGAVLHLVRMSGSGARPTDLWWAFCALFVAAACILALTRWEPDSKLRRLRRWSAALGMFAFGFCSVVLGYGALANWP